MTIARKVRMPQEAGALAALASVVAYGLISGHGLFSPDNLRLLAKQGAVLFVVSAAMTLVISTGGIDLSVGSTLGLSGMVLGYCVQVAHWPLAAACCAAVGVGALVGAVNGSAIAWRGLPPILVTLATFSAARAGASVIHAGASFSDIPAGLNSTLDQTNLAGLPVLLWIGSAALVAAYGVLRLTTLGRSLLALGGNRAAAVLSGISARRSEWLVYVATGAAAGLCGVLNTAYQSAATPDAGQYLELTAITAVVLGGTVVTGGRATVLGTVVGAATILLVLSSVRLAGLEDRVAWFGVGVALLLAVEVQARFGRQRA